MKKLILALITGFFLFALPDYSECQESALDSAKIGFSPPETITQSDWQFFEDNPNAWLLLFGGLSAYEVGARIKRTKRDFSVLNLLLRGFNLLVKNKTGTKERPQVFYIDKKPEKT